MALACALPIEANIHPVVTAPAWECRQLPHEALLLVHQSCVAHLPHRPLVNVGVQQLTHLWHMEAHGRQVDLAAQARMQARGLNNRL